MKLVLLLLLVLVIGTSVSLLYGLGSYTDSWSVKPPPGQRLIQEKTLPTPTPTAEPLSIPDKHVIPQQLHVFQTFNNCGPASLAMQLSYFDRDVTQKTLGESLRPYQHPTGDNDDKSVTLHELAQEAEKYNLNAIHRPNGSMEKLTQLVAQDLPVVIRTWLKEGEDIGHYRLVRGYDLTTQTLIQDDSLQGNNLSYTFDQMTSLWQAFNYEYLVLFPDDKAQVVSSILQEEINEQVAWQRSKERILQEIADDPTDIYAYFNLSVTHYHLGDYQAAVEEYEQVQNQLPSRMLWYQIEPLWAYYEVGEYDTLISKIDSILNNHNRGFAELYYLKGLIFQSEGNIAAARTEFEKSLIYKHNFTPARNALTALN